MNARTFWFMISGQILWSEKFHNKLCVLNQFEAIKNLKSHVAGAGPDRFA